MNDIFAYTPDYKHLMYRGTLRLSFIDACRVPVGQTTAVDAENAVYMFAGLVGNLQDYITL